MKKKISKENTIMVAILTKSGAPFNEEGVNYVRDMIVEKHPELKDRPIIAMMGDTVRMPMDVYTLWKTNPEMFIIVSYDEGSEVELFNIKGNQKIIDALYHYAIVEHDKTAWELFSGKAGGQDV